MINSYNPTFGTKFNTVKILETTTLKFIEPEGVSGLRPVIDTFWGEPFKAAGNRGYKYYLEKIGQRIVEKHPNIAEATEQILEFTRQNPQANKQELKEFVKPIIEKLGKEVDIQL